jgi:hypothetical protein
MDRLLESEVMIEAQRFSFVFALAALLGAAAMAAEVPPPANSTRSAKAAPAGQTAVPARTPAPTATPAAGEKLSPPPTLPVAQIIDRNVAARGGLAAWRAVNSMTISGEMDAGGKKDMQLPFVLSMKRPHKNRLELKFRDQTALQVWDGKQGWKVRPYLNRDDVESYTAAETKSAAAASELDGPLVDYARKGTTIELAGTDIVGGRNTYKLKLVLAGGEQVNLWIDAASFLEAKIDGDPRRMDGRMHKVAIFYRDFKSVNGLQIPHTMETVVEGVKGSHKMTIQLVKINPPLEDSLFSKPQPVLARASGS